MKVIFPEFYKPTDSEFKEMWDKGVFVLDTNILLSLYRLPHNTSKKLLTILEKIKERLWMPHQVAFEYQKRRLDVIYEQKATYNQMSNLLETTYSKLEKDFERFKKHPFVNCKSLLKKLATSHKNLTKDIAKSSAKHPDWQKKDSIREAIDKVFEGKVGEMYENKKLDEIYQQGNERFASEIPPGYKDKKKDLSDMSGVNKYGDLIIWNQIIDKAKELKNPIIFITDDQKEDWWWEVSGNRIGARYELIKEMKKEAGVDFYMYTSDQFMEYAGNYLSLKVEQSIIDEFKEVRIKISDEFRLTKDLDSDLSDSSDETISVKSTDIAFEASGTTNLASSGSAENSLENDDNLSIDQSNKS